MAEAHKNSMAEALAGLSGSEQRTLDLIFVEYPGLQDLFVDLLNRKMEAISVGDAASLRAISQDEKSLFEKAIGAVAT